MEERDGVSGSEDLTPQDVADNMRAMRRAEEVTQEQSGAFAAQPGWTASTIWSSDYAAPHGAAFYHGIADETVRVTFENMRYRLAFSVTKAVCHFHSAREVIEFVQEVEPHLRD